jgi:hypothetical protein
VALAARAGAPGSYLAAHFLSYLAFGALVALATGVELVAERRAPGWQRDLAALALTVAAACALGALATAAGFALQGAIVLGSLGAAREGLRDAAARFTASPPWLFAGVFGVVFPFGPLTVARLRRFSALGQILATAWVSAVVLGPLLGLYIMMVPGHAARAQAGHVGGIAALASVLGPALFALADRWGRGQTPSVKHDG